MNRVKFCANIVVALLLASSARADWTECVCRLRASDGLGTGCIFAVDSTHYYVLTNAHVAGRPGRRIQAEFFNSAGEQHPPLEGQTAWSHYATGAARDVAIVKVARVPEFNPTPVLLDDGNTELTPGLEIVTFGCPLGAPPKFLRATVIATGRKTFNFAPPGARGRSGSPVLSADGGRIIGVFTWGSPDGSHSKAQNAAAIRAALDGERPYLGARLFRRPLLALLERQYPTTTVPLARLERSQTGSNRLDRVDIADLPPALDRNQRVDPIQYPHECPNCGRGFYDHAQLRGHCDGEDCDNAGGMAGRPRQGGEFAPWEGPGGQQPAIPQTPAPQPQAPSPPAQPAPVAPAPSVVAGVTPAEFANQMAALETRLSAQIAALASAAQPGPPGPAGPQGPPGPAGLAGEQGQPGITDPDALAPHVLERLRPALSQAGLGPPPDTIAARSASGRLKGSDILGAIAATAAAAAAASMGLPPIFGWMAGKFTGKGASAAANAAAQAAAHAAATAAANARAAIHPQPVEQHLQVDAPPPTTYTQQINRYVPVEKNSEGLAYAKACAILAEAYPGTLSTIQSLQNLTKQIMDGQPHQFSAN